MKQATVFHFETASFNPEKRVFFFTYSVDFSDADSMQFQEIVQLPQNEELNELPEPLIKHLTSNLHLMLGISYWKLYCPKKLDLGTIKISTKQAEFWNTLYTIGLGEFYYRNELDFRNYVSFPHDEHYKADYFEVDLLDRALVGIGGGKDSLVAAEMVRKNGTEFSSFVVENSGQKTTIEPVLEAVGQPVLKVTRILDPQLLEIKDAYKGHLPISAIYAFLGITCALMFNYTYVIVSNERSANEGNVEYLGETINHQWSKSVWFERIFEEYVNEFLSPDIQYFSLLRPFSELRIMEMFAQYPQYFAVFSSCNRNFRINGEHEDHLRWCGECPKCAFSFIMMAAFLDKKTVTAIFDKNMFEDESLMPLYEELLGVKGIKPFDCVGTPDEVKVALQMIHEKKDYNDDPVYKALYEKYIAGTLGLKKLKEEVFTKGSSNLIPSTFSDIIDSV
jgi:hypothetical protein